MAITIEKDITEVTEGVIIHQVNCQNKMGSGVAKALYEKYPLIKQRYHDYCEGNSPETLLGCTQYVKVAPNLMVVNSFTQLNYGYDGRKYTDEEELITNIRWVSSEAEANALGLVYVPYLIGCGLGGGNWETIYQGISDLENLVICRLPQK